MGEAYVHLNSWIGLHGFALANAVLCVNKHLHSKATWNTTNGAPPAQHRCYPADFSQKELCIIHAQMVKIQGVSHEEVYSFQQG